MYNIKTKFVISSNCDPLLYEMSIIVNSTVFSVVPPKLKLINDWFWQYSR